MQQETEPAGVSLAETVYGRLLDALLAGEHPPGTFLNRRRVAERMGVSVAPVLEAMLRLEWEGFLESLPRRGTRVPAIDPAVVRGLHRVRTALERQAVRLVVGAPVRRAEADLLCLADTIEAVHRRSPERWRAEVAFHRRLVELAGCPVLLREVTRVLRLGLFHRLAALQDAEGGADAPLGPESDHQALVRRLVAAGTADEADAIVRMHIEADKPWAEPDGGPAIEPHREAES